MNLVTLLALIGGSIARIPALYIQSRRNRSKIWKIVPLTAVLTVFELAGTMLLFFVENGYFGGMSYYGGILLMPLFCIIISKVFFIPYLNLMDMFGAAAGGMLAVMRLQCVYFGCCNGIKINLSNSCSFDFPSPIVELVTVLVLMCIVVYLGKYEKYRGKLYPIYLILYGSTRFILNWFRLGNEPFVWILPPGNFWSLVAIAIGISWIMLMNFNERKLGGCEKEGNMNSESTS